MDNPPLPPQPTTTTPNDGTPNNPTTILKRKRTKRQRPTITITHSSTSYNPSNSSPPSSSDFPTTTEDEDTANSLILLSKGHNIIHSPIENFSDYCHKFNSKRYIQTSTHTTNGCTGTYVYECKTCSRTFPSFQALGGHRASHTKPRFIESDKPKPTPTPAFSFSDEDDTSTNNKKSSSKLCSICGAEFNSGQALGGHMRRHRATNGNTNTSTTLSLISYGHHLVVDDNIYDDEKSKSKADDFCLDLDLNLPAPVETNQDQHLESSFIFSDNQNKQQPSGYLSAAPTLVDCYY